MAGWTDGWEGEEGRSFVLVLQSADIFFLLLFSSHPVHR